jgi:hypothetical protein
MLCRVKLPGCCWIWLEKHLSQQGMRY